MDVNSLWLEVTQSFRIILTATKLPPDLKLLISSTVPMFRGASCTRFTISKALGTHGGTSRLFASTCAHRESGENSFTVLPIISCDWLFSDNVELFAPTSESSSAKSPEIVDAVDKEPQESHALGQISCGRSCQFCAAFRVVMGKIGRLHLVSNTRIPLQQQVGEAILPLSGCKLRWRPVHWKDPAKDAEP